jgi:hypothetical protein
MAVLADADGMLCPFALTALTTYSAIPVSVLGSANSGRVNPDATLCSTQPCARYTAHVGQLAHPSTIHLQ